MPVEKSIHSLQIEKILLNDPFSAKYFKGVLAQDELPPSKNKIKSSAYIINSDKRSEPGEHWYGVFYDSKSNCDFFDSLNMSPKFYGIEKFLIKTSKSTISNNIQLQSHFSEFCGYYAVLFILARSRNISYNKFLSYFNTDPLENDNIIEKF